MAALTPLARVLAAAPPPRSGQYRPNPFGTYRVLCPAHRDKNPSLGVRLGDNGAVLLRCYGGCRTEDVVAALGLEWRDLWP